MQDVGVVVGVVQLHEVVGGVEAVDGEGGGRVRVLGVGGEDGVGRDPVVQEGDGVVGWRKKGLYSGGCRNITQLFIQCMHVSLAIRNNNPVRTSLVDLGPPVLPLSAVVVLDDDGEPLGPAVERVVVGGHERVRGGVGAALGDVVLGHEPDRRQLVVVIVSAGPEI